MKKIAIPVLIMIVLAALYTVPALAQPEMAPVPLPAGTASPRDWEKHAPDGELLGTAVKAEAAILVDDRTGKVLFEKNPDARHSPASITKIMTCLLALESVENGHKLSELVTVGKLPELEAGSSKIGLVQGETMPLEDLLYGLMIKSGNDAANAIAIHLEGSVEKFAERANAKAQELGMTNTHYMNPHGLYHEDHYTTARDMATLAMAARKYPTFTKIVQTHSYTVAATNKHSSTQWVGHNKLIDPSKSEPFGYMYATGIKTGYTSAAQHTYVSSAKKDNVSLICVALRDGQSEKWTDAITMFEYGFNYYDTLDLKQLLGSQQFTLDVKNAAGSDQAQGRLDLLLLPRTPNAYITDRKEEIQRLKADPTLFVQQLDFTKDTAPIAKDEIVGKVSFTHQGNVVFECELLSPREVQEMPTIAPSASAAAPGSATSGVQPTGAAASPGADGSGAGSGGFTSVFIWLGILLLVLAVAMLTIRLVNMRRRNKKYRQYNYRQGGNSRMRR